MTAPCASRATSSRGARPDLESRERITRFVRDFYRQVAMDDRLGPVFAGAHVDWTAHIPKLVDFWAKQLLDEHGYEGNPLRAHQPVHARHPFGPELYERWLDLFTTCVDDDYEGPRAELAKARARRMARALRHLLEGNSASGSEPIVVGLATAPRERSTST